jgi:excisionase family DNA binding protein
MSVPPRRLLSDREAAQYIGASRSYVRALVANGVLRRVELPATDGNGGRARMLRLDVTDLDRFIDSLKT